MKWNDIFTDQITSLYHKNKLEKNLDCDLDYLKKAFTSATKYWISNKQHLEKVELIVIGEAPLMGKDDLYFYNPSAPETQFFRLSDLGIQNPDRENRKIELLNQCNAHGIVFIDLSPFSLNPKCTKINYREDNPVSLKIKPRDYRELIRPTLPHYFGETLNMLAIMNPEARVVFRYSRLKKDFHDDVLGLCKRNGFLTRQGNIDHVSSQGGGVNRNSIANIIF